MPTMVIKNGHVFDPLNEIDGEVMDVFIKDGKVVEDLTRADLARAKAIDARGKTVMPGGVDSHAHVAGAKVNAGRLMRPEDHIGSVRQRTEITHSGSGYTVPTVYKQGYDYSAMGYTTVFEAAMPPLEARHTHEEMRSTPMLDMGAYLVLGNNWFLMRYLHEGEVEKAAAYVAWMMKAHKAYGIKCVNPAGVENWGWGRNVHSLDEPNIHFEVTAREVIHGLAEVNERLGMPISLHLHANNLGHPGNAEITKESLEVPSDVVPSQKMGVEWAETKLDPHRAQSVYLAHAQFNAFGGTSWRDFESGAAGLARYVNKADHVVIDNGAVPFGPATCMTGDGPSIHDLYVLAGIGGQKWSNTDVELECGSGVIPFTYLKGNPISAVQWAIGLEMLLHNYRGHRAGLGTGSTVDAGIYSVGHLLDDLTLLPIAVEEGVGWTDIDACPAGLADLIVPGKFSGKGFLKRNGIFRTDGGTPATVNASIEIYQGLSLKSQAAISGEPPILELDAAPWADLGA